MGEVIYLSRCSQSEGIYLSRCSRGTGIYLRLPIAPNSAHSCSSTLHLSTHAFKAGIGPVVSVLGCAAWCGARRGVWSGARSNSLHGLPCSSAQAEGAGAAVPCGPPWGSMAFLASLLHLKGLPCSPAQPQGTSSPSWPSSKEGVSFPFLPTITRTITRMPSPLL